MRPQPVDRAARSDLVETVPAERMANEVARREIIREAVFLHFRRHELRDRGGFELARQMPLALVSGVVAGLPQHMAERRNLEREILHPRHIEIFEHAVVGCLQSSQHHRARRRAHRRRTLVICKSDASSLKPLMPGEHDALRPLCLVALLVGEDEEDVHLAGARST